MYNASLIREIRMIAQGVNRLLQRTGSAKSPFSGLLCHHCLVGMRSKNQPAVTLQNGTAVCREHAF